MGKSDRAPTGISSRPPSAVLDPGFGALLVADRHAWLAALAWAVTVEALAE